MKRYLCVLLVAGCAEIQPQPSQEEILANYLQRLHATCASYGFRDGSPEFQNCLMQVDQATKNRRSATSNTLLQQMLQNQQQALPLCSSLPPGLAGYRRAEGGCR